ncbi:hypothetical protein N7G274_005693 [Stereocaulon virgatum]|uniref:Uncharacterized protein n=1 Tax=Stereocaulon virgatum TaxID=373712 RepID=A0ABR4A8S2_9LECA
MCAHESSKFNGLINVIPGELEEWLKHERLDRSGLRKWLQNYPNLEEEPKKDLSQHEEEDLSHTRKAVSYCRRRLARKGNAKQDMNSKSDK